MAENVFGVETDPDDSKFAWLKDDEPEIVEEPTTESDVDAAAEGTPSEEGPPRDERGRFIAQDAPEVDTTPPTDPNVFQPTEADLAALADAGAEAPAEEVVEEETPAEAAERLYANKYRSPEDLEKGYRERSDMWRRALEQARAEEARRVQIEAEKAEYEAAFQQIIPVLEQASSRERQMHEWARQYQQETGQFPPGYQPPPANQGPPALGTNDVQALVDRRLAEERAQMAAQFQQQREAEALSAAVNGFYAQHPEVEPYGALDTEITDAMAILNDSEAWLSVRNQDGSYGVEADPTDPGTLEVLYEASQRPALLEVLRLRPEYFSSAQGLQIARRDASLLEGVPATTEPQVQRVPASRAGARAGQKIPFAESATGAVPEDTGPDLNDPWERVKAVDSREKASGKKIVFFE